MEINGMDKEPILMSTVDMTPYLVLAVNHAVDFFRQYDNGFPAESVNPLSAVLAMKTRLYATHLKFFGAFKRFDIKRKMAELHQGAVVLSGVEQTGWVDYSAPGNILFGYVSAARGLDRKICWAAGGLLESLDMGRLNPEYREFWYDNPGDKAAVDFGWDLYMAQRGGLTLALVQEHLTTEVFNRLQAPMAIPDGSPAPYQGDLAAYPYAWDAFLNLDDDEEDFEV